jgi:hypothetical protein
LRSVYLPRAFADSAILFHVLDIYSKAATLLRALHIEGLPPTMTAAELSTLMAPYGNVQYAEVSTTHFNCTRLQQYRLNAALADAKATSATLLFPAQVSSTPDHVVVLHLWLCRLPQRQ